MGSTGRGICGCIYANPIIKESVAKQLFRSQRQQRPAKAGHPDEPMRDLTYPARDAWWERGSPLARQRGRGEVVTALSPGITSIVVLALSETTDQ
ncbi:unnamed protein product [Boreogadus saida]